MREFGNVLLTRERSRDVWRWILLDDFVSDLRYAVAALDPATIATAVLALLGAALLVVLIPALRASSIDPMAALREDSN